MFKSINCLQIVISNHLCDIPHTNIVLFTCLISMGARKNFRTGGGVKPKKVPHKDKKASHMVKRAPHKEKNVAKRLPHGEKPPPPIR